MSAGARSVVQKPTNRFCLSQPGGAGASLPQKIGPGKTRLGLDESNLSRVWTKAIDEADAPAI